MSKPVLPRGVGHQPARPPHSLEGFVAAPGFDEALALELGVPRARPGEPRWPGLVTVATQPPLDPAFALQRLPAAVLVRGESVRELAEATFALADPVVDATELPFSLHVYVPDPERYRTIEGRARLLGQALGELWRERRRRAARRCQPAGALAWGEGLIVQAALVGRSSLLVSVGAPRALPGGGFDVAPWPGGLAPVAEDKTAPSRAYGKLEEGFAWLGAAPAPGERVVDLGGSPGGWAWKALSRGAQVIAVDRSPLTPPAAGHRALSMVIGNAFTYEPTSPVDWLLCDVICEPTRTFELVERWMVRGWARHVIATVKFKGRTSYDVLAPARERLKAHGWSFLRIKHMFRHHNEVVILARR